MTVFGAPLSLAKLRKREASYLPALNEDGQVDRLILESMSGDTSLSDIACRVSDQFPARFARGQDALIRVGDLSQK